MNIAIHRSKGVQFGSLLALSALAAAPALAQSVPKIRPWVYEPGESTPTWDRHRWLEDDGNTAYVLARELVTVTGQSSDPHPEIFVFNHAHYTPPAGVPAAAGTRRFHTASVEDRGVQMYVNYSSVPMVSSSQSYGPGTFFVAQPQVLLKDQADPPVEDYFDLSGDGDVSVSATRAAFGFKKYAAAHSKLKRYVQSGAEGEVAPCPELPNYADLLYVAAGIDYAWSDFDPVDWNAAKSAQRDRLYAWEDNEWVSVDLPAVAAEGNTGAVVLADFNGDTVVDAYVGKSGDSWAGAPDVLLEGSLSGTCSSCTESSNCALTFTVTTGRLPTPGGQPIAVATSDVEVADLDLDGDLDLVVVGRVRWSGTPGTESHDYALINNGSGNFSQGLVWLDRTGSDSRSVAVGNLNGTAGAAGNKPEIVIGNAGAGEFSSELALPQTLAANQRLDIFTVTGSYGLPGGPYFPIYSEVRNSYMDADVEARNTSPLTYQVLLVDLFGNPAGGGFVPYTPDGYLDLVIVNGREHLKSEDLEPTDAGWETKDGESIHQLGSNVHFLRNAFPQTASVGLVESTESTMGESFPIPWIRCAAPANFVRFNVPPVAAEVPTLDLFLGTGNRIQGSLNYFLANTGGANDLVPPATNPHQPWSKVALEEQTYNLLPGVEKGYGFDFADYNEDGHMDALAAARSYNYAVDGIAHVAGGHVNWHLDLSRHVTNPSKDLSNRRWQLYPRGMEDGVFAYFNEDELLDAVLASQMDVDDPNSIGAPETIVALGTGASGDNPPFENATRTIEFKTEDPPNPPSSEPGTVDALIDLNGRTSFHHAETADRAVACDMDNDGDVDCIVRLFAIASPTPPTKKLSQLMPPDAISKMTAGWRYLVNLTEEGNPGGYLFRDEAPTRMLKGVGGTFSELYNRKLGYELLADLDNNGYMDMVSISNDSSVQVTDPYQARNLLFLNNYSGSGAGTLIDVTEDLIGGQIALPPASIAAVWHDYEFDASGLLIDPSVPYNSGNAFTGAQGDADNDGDADLFVGYTVNGYHTNYPSLLINKKESIGVQGTHFIDEYQTRMDFPSFTDLIYSPPLEGVVESAPGVWTKTTYENMDSVWAGGFIDFDADGDNDLVYIVSEDYPRFLRNKGADTNGDGIINGADVTPEFELGEFEDVTVDVIGATDVWSKQVRDCHDFQVVDLDGDGDLDFATYTFNDKPTLWRNEVDLGDRPAVTEIWPRVGSVRGSPVTLHGIHMDEVEAVRLIFDTTTKNLAPSDIDFLGATPTRLDITIPTDSPVGLAQVQVQRQLPSSQLVWGTQYFGYFVLD
jgi:hypothetical protein